MTKSEFITKNQLAQRKMRRSVVTGFATVGICSLIGAVLQSFPIYRVILGIGLASFYVMILVAGLRYRVVGRCAHCGKSLGVERFSTRVAIATGHCGFCGEPAFAEEKAK